VIKKYATASVIGTGVLREAELAKKTQNFIDSKITLFQHTFSKPNWRAALGSFDLDYELKGASKDGNRNFVRLSGQNLYQWHPDNPDLPTHRLHEIGNELVAMKKASTFWMRARPILFVVYPSKRQIEGAETPPLKDFNFQTNDRNPLKINNGVAWKKLGFY
jgi:hypothetical protein